MSVAIPHVMREPPPRSCSRSPSLPHNDSYSLMAVMLVFAVPGMADLLYGFDCGAVSYALLQIQTSGFHDNKDVSGVCWGHVLVNRPALRGFVVSSAAIGAFLASLVIFSLDTSRKRELQVGSLFYMAGALLQVVSSIPESAFIAISMLIIGRLVYGLGIGTTMHAAPAYLGEMSPTNVRGILLSLKEAANTVGLLLGYRVGYSFSNVSGGWKWSFLVSASIAACSLVLSFLIPRSGRWLLLHEKDEEALQSIRFVFTDDSVEMTFNKIKRYLDTGDRAESKQFNGRATSLWDRSNRRALITGLGIIVLQQITGCPAMLSYASTVFQQAGNQTNSSVHMAMFQLVVTLFAVATVERLGRKVLLYVGCMTMTVALVILALCFGNRDGFVWLAMFSFVGGYQLGFGPIAWLIVAEVFPNALRGKATALCVQANFSSYGLVQFAIPILANFVGFENTFALFAALSMYSIFFVQAFVPETKGLTLEDVQGKLGSQHCKSGRANGDFAVGLPDECKYLLSDEDDAI